MSGEIQKAALAIDSLATALDNWWTTGLYISAQGWSAPSISRDDLSFQVRALSARVRNLDEEDISTDIRSRLARIPDQINLFTSQTLPNGNGNGIAVVSALEPLLFYIDHLAPQNGPKNWEDVSNSNLIPQQLARRIRSIEASLRNLEPRANNIQDQVEQINSAHAAAVELPTDLENLREARTELIELSETTRPAHEKVLENAKISEALLVHIRDVQSESEEINAEIKKKYSAATSYGLASAFNERANNLSRTTWVWVVMLITALVLGGVISTIRINSLQASLKEGNWQVIVVNSVISLLSIAAPVWFAWVSTRQIGQRFRLAEDYSFKAAVAQAYEGYRAEAARIDSDLEKRLFSSALDRLEEAPLRFLAIEEYNTPYQELLSSPGFMKVMQIIPGANREELMETITRAFAPRRRKRRKNPFMREIEETVAPGEVEDEED